jgi:hypothetical protein
LPAKAVSAGGCDHNAIANQLAFHVLHGRFAAQTHPLDSFEFFYLESRTFRIASSSRLAAFPCIIVVPFYAAVSE